MKLPGANKKISKNQLGLFSPAVLVPFTELDAARQAALKCTKCDLCQTRKNVVFGEGKTDRPDIMFIGEAPGETEDEMGRPFVGKAGRYLEKMLSAIGYNRKDLYIANVVNCRPPENRKPSLREVAQCSEYLIRQIRSVNPMTIMLLGKTAAETVLGKPFKSIESARGRWYMWDQSPLRVTYHPAFLLRGGDKRTEALEDLKAIRARVNQLKAVVP